MNVMRGGRMFRFLSTSKKTVHASRGESTRLQIPWEDLLRVSVVSSVLVERVAGCVGLTSQGRKNRHCEENAKEADLLKE